MPDAPSDRFVAAKHDAVLPGPKKKALLCSLFLGPVQPDYCSQSRNGRTPFGKWIKIFDRRHRNHAYYLGLLSRVLGLNIR